MRRPTRDDGSVHVLEAVVVASIMVSAIAFVVTFDNPPATNASARGELAHVAQDALSVLYSTPVTDSKFGADALSAAIGECLNDDCARLKARLDRMVPTGGAYALYISNGFETYPVYVMGEPDGEAVSASQSFEPSWSSTFVSTATDMVGTNGALLTYELPVFNSNVVSLGGSHLIIKLTGSRKDGSDYVMIASGSTVARAQADAGASAASLSFVDALGAPLAVHDLGGALRAPMEVLLRVQESQGGSVPSGVEVAVELPRGFTGIADQSANPGWTILANATDKNGSYAGSTIRATLNESLTSSAKDLRLLLSYEGDVLDYYPVHARLSRGAFASASVLLRAQTRESDPPLATPSLLTSIPNPLGNGALTTWTLAAYIPVNESSLVGDLGGEVRVRSIEIREQEGNMIFGDVEGLSPSMGDWTSHGDAIVWNGDIELSYSTLLNLSFQVRASGTAGPSEARAAFVPPVTFDHWTGKVLERTGWGFQRTAILPETSTYAGFNTTAAGGETAYKKQHPISADGTYRATPLPGRSTYNTSVVGAVEEALYGSYVTAEKGSVPVGGEVVISANVQSLLFTLAEAGQRAGVTLRFYPPWAADSRIPIFEQENLDQGLLSGEVTQVVMLDVNGDGFPDPIVGTTNGRVLSYNGLTGQRLQGNSFTAPVSTFGADASATPRINVLTTTTLFGKSYIVVGTDKNSDGVFVLKTDLSVAWRAVFSAADVLAIDATTDMTVGDALGQPEIIVARSYDSGGTKNSLVYVFRANPRASETVAEALEPIPADPVVAQDANAFFYSLGVPTTIQGQARLGPFGTTAGVLVPTQTTLDPGLTINRDVFPPTTQQGSHSTPRGGVQAIDANAHVTSTLFGSPAAVLRTYDYGGDLVDDVVLGGSSGYVVMSNGTVLTQPLYSYIPTGISKIISADSPSSTISFALSDAGQVTFTDDTWMTMWLMDTPAPGARAIAAPTDNSFRIVGAANQMWASSEIAHDYSGAGPHMPTYLEVIPDPPVVAEDPTYFVARSHDFNGVWMRGAEGWVVGSMCTGILCPTVPLVMHTTNGGVSWSVLGALDFDGTAPTQSLTQIRFMPDGTGWMVGEGGTLLRYAAGTGPWKVLAVGAGGTSETFRDIACKPNDLDTCLVVGDDGVAFQITNARGTPTWESLTGTRGLPTDRTLFAVGYQSSERVYIGSTNMALASFDGGDWTTLPMNYLESDVRVINARGDGSGFIFGGTAAVGRIWLLHDFHTQSMAQTLALGDFPPGAVITNVALGETNVTLGLQQVVLKVATNGENWKTLGTLSTGGDDPRQASPLNVDFGLAASAADLRLQILMNTSGDKTILSPHVRLLTLRATCTDCGTPSYRDIAIDFASDAVKDPVRTSADWNTTQKVLRQRLVTEYWTRNVSGEVLDIRSGFDLNGDGRDELYVATGDILSENSPDHIIYAGTNLSRVIEPDDRVYILNGANGHPLFRSEKLDGEVRSLRIADPGDDLVPDGVYVVTYNKTTLAARLYGLDAQTLGVIWSTSLGSEETTDLELGEMPGAETSIFASTLRTANPSSAGHLHAYDAQTYNVMWRAIPDDMGKYEVKAKVEPGWLFGPYVVEVEVEWQEAVDVGGVPTEILRSARFYDHFMVTPPDAVSPPTPIYTARLLVWMRDWG